jgi:hypothetical protein
LLKVIFLRKVRTLPLQTSPAQFAYRRIIERHKRVSAARPITRRHSSSLVNVLIVSAARDDDSAQSPRVVGNEDVQAIQVREAEKTVAEFQFLLSFAKERFILVHFSWG